MQNPLCTELLFSQGVFPPQDRPRSSPAQPNKRAAPPQGAFTPCKAHPGEVPPRQPGRFPSAPLVLPAQLCCLPEAVKVGLLQQLLTALPLCRVHPEAALQKMEDHTKHSLHSPAQFLCSPQPRSIPTGTHINKLLTDSKSGCSESAQSLRSS